MGHHCECDKRDKKGCVKCTKLVTKKDFCSHGKLSKTFVISKPGKYCLEKSIAYSPLIAGTSAIIIDSSDVVLDLCGNTLSQANVLESTIGILIKNGHEQIKVHNGTIKNFGQLGVSVEGAKYLDFEDLLVTGNGAASPNGLANSAGVAQFQGGLQLGSTQYYASQGFPGPIGVIEFLTVKNVKANQNKPFGICMGLGHDYIFEDSEFSENFEDRQTIGKIGGGSFAGDRYKVASGHFLFTSPLAGDPSIPNWRIERCKFNGNYVLNENPDLSVLCVGMEHSSTQTNCLYKDCEFNNNDAGPGIDDTVTQITYGKGFDLGGGFAMTFDGCQFCGNRSQLGAGLHFSGTVPAPNAAFEEYDYIIPENVVVNNCVANENVGTNTNGLLAYGGGFEVFGGKNIVIKNSVATGNRLDVPPENAFGIPGGNLAGRMGGIRCGPGGGVPTREDRDYNLTNLTIENCVLTGNVANNTIGYPIPGIPDSINCGVWLLNTDEAELTKNVTIRDCVIRDNTAKTEFRPESSGILIQSFFEDSNQAHHIFENNVIDGHDNGVSIGQGGSNTVAGNTITNGQVGVKLDENTVCNWVKNNCIGYVDTGVSDTLDPSTSIVASNELTNTNTPVAVNYTFGPAPVTSGDLTTGYPSLPSVAGENVSIDGGCAPLAPVARVLENKASKKVTLSKEQLELLKRFQ